MSNTTDFTVKITGIPKKQFALYMEDLKRGFLKEHKFIFEPSNDIVITFDECQKLTDMEAFYGILSHAITVKAIKDEIKNGN